MGGTRTSRPSIDWIRPGPVLRRAAGKGRSGTPRRRPGSFRPVLVLSVLVVPGAVSAGSFEGLVGVEIEYLGEAYRSTFNLTADDLGLPGGSSLLVSESERFTEDTWLPGGKLDLAWRTGGPRRVEVLSRTAHNAERTNQEVEFLAETAPPGASRWGARVVGAVREDDRSLVGHGDWQGKLEIRRESLRGRALGSIVVGWERSRTRGDTTSYLYDYDLLRARVGLREVGWLPGWETFLEGSLKEIPGGEPGSYAEVRAGGTRRGRGESRISLDARFRDVDTVEVGRDHLDVEASFLADLGPDGESLWSVEGGVTWTEADGEDDLYFDALQIELGLPWRRGRALSLEAGPILRGLRDLNGGDRDYLQGSLRGSAGALAGGGTLADLTLEGGYRDYPSDDARVVEIASLSSSLLRTDYWFLDVLGVFHRPLALGTGLDLTASWSWELHPLEDERIQVAFATLGVSRAF